MKELFTLIFCLLVIEVTAQTNYRSNGAGGGNWSAVGTWQVETPNGSGTWIAATNVPTDANSTSIQIQNGDNVTVDVVVSPLSIDETTIDAGGTITVGGSATLVISDGTGNDLTVNGTLAITAGAAFPPTPSGTLSVNGQLVFSGTAFTGTSATRTFFNAGSTYDHALTGAAAALPVATWDLTSTCLITGDNNNTVPGNLNQNLWQFHLEHTGFNYKY